MITASDSEYKATKLIRQGKATLQWPFLELAEWIAAKWRVSVLNVVYDQPVVIDHRPRLQVILEHSHELEHFRTESRFDPAAQRAIAEQFSKIVKGAEGPRYEVEDLLVVFADFSRIALQEADSRITDADIQALQKEIADPHLWTIHRSFGRVVFMFQTDEQMRMQIRAGLQEPYASRYFEVLKRYDEFKYLSRARFAVEFDSKENFDKKYEGSWFNYDR